MRDIFDHIVDSSIAEGNPQRPFSAYGEVHFFLKYGLQMVLTGLSIEIYGPGELRKGQVFTVKDTDKLYALVGYERGKNKTPS